MKRLTVTIADDVYQAIAEEAAERKVRPEDVAAEILEDCILDELEAAEDEEAEEPGEEQKPAKKAKEGAPKPAVPAGFEPILLVNPKHARLLRALRLGR